MSTAESLTVAVGILKNILGSVRVLVESFGNDLISNFSNLMDLQNSRFLGLNTDLTIDPSLVLGEKATVDVVQQWIKDLNSIHLQERSKGLWSALASNVNNAEHILSQLRKLKGYNPALDKETSSNASNSRPTTASSAQHEVLTNILIVTILIVTIVIITIY
jgi:hypothetical protein